MFRVTLGISLTRDNKRLLPDSLLLKCFTGHNIEILVLIMLKNLEIHLVRPLQFNYLSYELFLEKKSCQTPKKRKKKSLLVSYGRKWF